MPPDAFDPNVTLKIFREFRTDAELRRLYERAIGDRPGNERGNALKAKLNRSLGALSKAAVGAEVKVSTPRGERTYRVQRLLG